jgi:bifunctional DNase/RNase
VEPPTEADAAVEPAVPAQALVELGLSEVRPSVLLRPGQEAGLVVLAEMDEPFRSLHIYVGQPEAKAIQAGWHGDRPVRPGTWDLFVQAMELLGARLDKVVIERVEEARHFFARVDFERAGEFFSLACRPSDAIALAVRVPAAGLYATEEVLATAGRYPD